MPVFSIIQFELLVLPFCAIYKDSVDDFFMWTLVLHF